MLSKAMIGMIHFYKAAISPHLGDNCRYTPTCSTYSIQAIEKYGPIKGGKKAFLRIISCHPWGGKGYDPLD